MPVPVGANSQLLRIAEVTWGTTPTTPTGIFTRYTGLSLNPVKDVFESKEIRNDRQTSDLRHGILMGVGDIDVEHSNAAYDDLLESAMFSAWSTNDLLIGSTRKSFTMEVGHTGVAQYISFTGCVVDKMQISFKPGEIVTGKFSIKAQDAARAGTTLFSATSAAATGLPYDTFTGTITEGGSPIATVTALDFTLDNQLEEAKVIGSSSLYDLQPKRAKITGTLTAFFTDGSLLDKFLAETASSLVVSAAAGTKSLTFDFSNIKYTGGKVDVNTEGLLAIDLPFVALYHATDTALKITRDNT
jgi:hypothetical protein